MLVFVGCSSGQSGESAPAGRFVNAPPGAPDYPPTLRKQLRDALAARGPDYVPRTRHLREDGSPKYCNRLLLESSPYLRQHAHNPVDWYPWSEEAFETARRLGRPVLLSVGYSTCHWCHVMEEESFEDEEIAAYLNANYIAIKVDREERPDIDAIYMKAVQMMVGRGGWPMTAWLTAEAEPFFGGTYFPARDGERGASRGFLTLLQQLKHYYDQQPEQAAARAREITRRIRASSSGSPGTELPSAAVLSAALQAYESMFDRSAGGLNGSPKFPSSLPLRLLLRESERTGNATYRDMALLTLTKMADGGIYDQVGGGFHRYATDERWLVPHFEKMLYDNALLAHAYLEGYQASGAERLARIAEEVLSYAIREMASPQGAFYSATDADSLTPLGEREEGRFFTWTPDELRQILGEQRAGIVASYFGVTAPGNFEGRNILHVARPADRVAEAFELRADELRRVLIEARQDLYEARRARPAPLRDDKVLTAWNGLMISALARGGFVLDRPVYLEQAERAAAFLLEHLRSDQRLSRSFIEGRARFNAYLDDYACLIAGLIDLYQAAHEVRWIREAIALQSTLDRHYWDAAAGGYYRTSDDHQALLAREKPANDGAVPSGNSVALMNLIRLHALTLDDRYRARADSVLRAFAGKLERYPTGVSEMLLGLQFRLADPREIVIVTPNSREQARPFLAVLRKKLVADAVISVAVEGSDLRAQASLLAPLKGKVARDSVPTAYVCRQGSCRLPVTDADAFARQLLERIPAPDPADPEKTGVIGTSGH